MESIWKFYWPGLIGWHHSLLSQTQGVWKSLENCRQQLQDSCQNNVLASAVGPTFQNVIPVYLKMKLPPYFYWSCLSEMAAPALWLDAPVCVHLSLVVIGSLLYTVHVVNTIILLLSNFLGFNSLSCLYVGSSVRLCLFWKCSIFLCVKSLK